MKKIKKEKGTTQTLPSRFKHGDKVHVNFYESGIIKNCEVIKVAFTESSVYYDVEVSVPTKDADTGLPYPDAPFMYERLHSLGAGWLIPATT